MSPTRVATYADARRSRGEIGLDQAPATLDEAYAISAGVAHANPGDDPRDCQASAWPPQGDASGQTSPWLPQGVLSGPRTDNNAGNCVFRIILPPP